MLAYFEEILGHEPQKAYLSRILKEGSLSHAYCFSGPDGVGKNLFVKSIADFYFGESVFHPNLKIVERLFDEKNDKLKDSVSVEQIRRLIEHLSMTSFGGGKKIAVIRDADRMTPGAQNALLKTLEEPQGETHIFLLAEDETKLLPTILSRSVHLRFSRVPREDICRLAREKGLSKEVAHMVAGYADGRPEVALRLLNGDERQEQFEQISLALMFIDAALPARLALAEEIARANKDRSKVEQFVRQVERVLHDLLLSSLTNNHLLAFSDRQETISELAAKHTRKEWLNALKTSEDVIKHLAENGNSTIALEQLSLSF